MPPCFFIFGFGYSANFLAQQLSQLGFRVIGTTRDREKIKQHATSDYELIDFCHADIKKYLSFATHILVSTPPVATIGDPVLANYSELFKQYAAQIEWMGYLSSTGVYGNHNGAWVDESSSPVSLGAQGQLRLEAEQAWIFWAQEQQLPLHIFRLAGIYGPKRNVLERILGGKQYSIFKKDHFFSRIHVSDIVAVILASIQLPHPFSIYNVADDEPTPSHVVDSYASLLLHQKALPLIPYNDASMSPREHEFYSNNRRVSNIKIKNELQVNLNYPSYREGLSQLLAILK